MEFLKKLFGTTEDGKAEALTYEQLMEKIKGDKDLKIVNLSDGGYVSQDKFTASETEAKGYKKQLEDAQKEIKSYKDMNIEEIKANAAKYEEDSKKEIAALNKQLADQKRGFAEERFLSKYQFTDDFAKAGVLAEFRTKNFAYDEASGTFAGAEQYMKEIMESHKGAFVIAEPDGGKGGKDGKDGSGAGAGDNGGKDKPSFLGKPGNNNAGGNGGGSDPFGFSFMGVRANPANKQ